MSRGRPTSARERRRQRERKSMADQQSVLPSSNHTPSSSSDKVTAAPKSSGSQGLLFLAVILVSQRLVVLDL